MLPSRLPSGVPDCAVTFRQISLVFTSRPSTFRSIGARWSVTIGVEVEAADAADEPEDVVNVTAMLNSWLPITP